MDIYHLRDTGGAALFLASLFFSSPLLIVLGLYLVFLDLLPMLIQLCLHSLDVRATALFYLVTPLRRASGC